MYEYDWILIFILSLSSFLGSLLDCFDCNDCEDCEDCEADFLLAFVVCLDGFGISSLLFVD